MVPLVEVEVAIENERGALEDAMTTLLCPLIDQDLSVVFYDLTTVGVEGGTQLEGDVSVVLVADRGLLNLNNLEHLADIERGFHMLKSGIEIGPVYHRLPKRIRAHAAICFMALIPQRVMRQRLKAAGSALSPDHALKVLRRVQRHRV